MIVLTYNERLLINEMLPRINKKVAFNVNSLVQTSPSLNLLTWDYAQITAMVNITAYLLDNDLAIPEDWTKRGSILTLSSKGEMLLEIGSIETFWQLEANEHEKQKRREQLNDELLEVSLKTQRSLLLINRWIAVGAVVAATYYLFEVLRNYYNPALPIFRNYVLPLGLLVTVLSLILRYLWRHLLKRKKS